MPVMEATADSEAEADAQAGPCCLPCRHANTAVLCLTMGTCGDVTHGLHIKQGQDNVCNVLMTTNLMLEW